MKRTIAVTGAIGLAVFMGACGTDDDAQALWKRLEEAKLALDGEKLQ